MLFPMPFHAGIARGSAKEEDPAATDSEEPGGEPHSLAAPLALFRGLLYGFILALIFWLLVWWLTHH